MIYLDSSAIVKLAHEEPESAALAKWIGDHAQPLATSALARTEAVRALRRVEPDALRALSSVLTVLNQHPVTDSVLDAAADLPDPLLRSLDAIHLATAERLAPALTWFVAYDHRLAKAAEARGLRVATP